MSKLIVGRFGAPFGVKGWVKVISFTDPPTNIFDYQDWCIAKQDEWLSLEVEATHLHGKVLVTKLAGCDDRNKAAIYTNQDIWIERSQLPNLDANEYYWSDLENLDVIDQHGETLGQVDHLLETGANDVLVVKGKTIIMIPYLKHVIKQIDLEKSQITVDWDSD